MHRTSLAVALIAMLSQNGVRVVHESQAPPPFPDKPPPLPPMLTSQRNDPRHWNTDTLPRYQWPADRDRDATSAAYLKAQAKRDRKNAKRLRDAKGGNNA